MPMGKKLAASSALLVTLGLGPNAWAQFTSSIEGVVTDPSGAVVPAATVTVTNDGTGVSHTTQTSDRGYYRVPALPPAVFTVRVSRQGFKDAVLERVRLQAAEVRTFNPVLEVGAAGSEEVTVTADVLGVETAEGRVSGLIEEGQVEDLPLVGRNFFNLVVLTPGVTGTSSGAGFSYAQSNADIYNNEFGVNMNANGARRESNNFMVDSATISSTQRSGVVNVNPNTENVQEVRVAVNNFSAEYGRNASVLVNVVTKTGTNAWHGGLSGYYTNDSLQGKNLFQEQTPGFEHPDFSRKEVSWGLGGPIRKDSTFFFVSGDVLRADVAIARSASIVTPQFIDFMRQARPNNTSTYVMGTFPASFQADHDFRTAGSHLGVECAGSAPIASPVGPVPCDLPVTGVGTFSTTSPRNGFQWTARVDHHFGQGRDRIYASFHRTDLDKVLFGTPDVYPDFNVISPTNSTHLNANWTKLFSSSLMNEVAFSWVRVYGDLPLNRPDVPGINVTGIERYQTNWGPNDFVQNNFEFRDVVTWTRGAHSMKFGASYARGHADNEGSRVFQRPIYNFDSVFDFAADSPSSQGNLGINPLDGAEVTDLLRQHRTNDVSLFVQDSWKVSRNFTLNLGLRYEAFLNIYDGAGDITGIEFTGGRTGDLTVDLPEARVVERDYMLDGGLWGGGQHTLGPRASFAWDVSGDGKTSLRGGVGRFYERMSNQLWDSEYTNLPGFAVTTATIFDPVTRPRFGLGASPSPPFSFPRPDGLAAGLLPNGGLQNGLAKADVLDPTLGTMYLDNWFLGVQRQVAEGVVVEANYIGSRGNSMYVRYNVNRFNGDLFDGVLDRLMPGYSSLLYGQALDESRYHGGTLSARFYRRGFQLGAAYTLGKATDFSSTATPSARPDAHGPASQDEGPSDGDIRHKIAVTFNWSLPSPSSSAAKAVFGGWQLAGLVIAQSGSPFTVHCTGRSFQPIRDGAGNIVGNAGCDYNADGEGNDRPNTPAFGDSREGLSNDDFLDGIFTAADFPTPAPGVQGALGRNTYRGPRYFNVDLTLAKSFTFPVWSQQEGALQVRLEVFNLFNTTNLNNPQNNLTSPLFGRSDSALPGRVVQFAGRFSF